MAKANGLCRALLRWCGRLAIHWSKGIYPTNDWAAPHKPSGQNTGRPDPSWRKVNGFWVGVCQDGLFRSASLAENPIDCRIFFADNTRRKTESGIGGKNL